MLKLWPNLLWGLKEISCSKILLHNYHAIYVQWINMWYKLTHERKVFLSLKCFIYVSNQGTLSAEKRATSLFEKGTLLLTPQFWQHNNFSNKNFVNLWKSIGCAYRPYLKCSQKKNVNTEQQFNTKYQRQCFVWICMLFSCIS